MTERGLSAFLFLSGLAGFSLISCSDPAEPPPEVAAEEPSPEPGPAPPVTTAPESSREAADPANQGATIPGTRPATSPPSDAAEEAATESAPPPKMEDDAEATGDEAAGSEKRLTFPEIAGVDSPVETDILWTAYYIAPVTRDDPEKGRTLTFTDLAEKKIRYTVTGKSFRRAEMEAVAVGIDKEGKTRFGYRVDEGVWRELPEGSMGMGNKVNALVPLVHVAADQSTYPYGSLVHVPEAVDREFGDGKKMTGYFWIADTGGRIEGDHFDLFVGREEVYSGFLDTVKHQHHQTKIYPLPRVEKSWDPRNHAGLTRVLISTGHLDAPPDSEKVKDETLREALVAFQKDQPFIPSAEYGDPDAATTLWFLTQAAVKARSAEPATESVAE